MIKVSQQCSRCRREEDVEVGGAEEAILLDKLQERQTEATKKLSKFLEENGKDLPDFIAILSREPVKLITHNHLCNDPDAKRSCVKRIETLMSQLDALPEPKPKGPRKKKETAPAAPSAETKSEEKPIPLTNVKKDEAKKK
jgi:hypothetical protein